MQFSWAFVLTVPDLRRHVSQLPSSTSDPSLGARLPLLFVWPCPVTNHSWLPGHPQEYTARNLWAGHGLAALILQTQYGNTLPSLRTPLCLLVLSATVCFIDEIINWWQRPQRYFRIGAVALPAFPLSGLHGVLPVRGVIKRIIDLIFHFYHLWRCPSIHQDRSY